MEKTALQDLIDNPPSKKTDGSYAVLQEQNDDRCQTLLYFLRTENNEENLRFLQDQLESVEWEVPGTVFDLDLTHLVSAQTAKEMSKVELNPIFHRKFDGVLKRIDFKFKSKYSNERKIDKICELLEDGGIDDFIDDEDIDEEDLINNPYSSSDDYETSDDDVSSSEDDSSRPVRSHRDKIPDAFKRNKAIREKNKKRSVE